MDMCELILRAGAIGMALDHSNISRPINTEQTVLTLVKWPYSSTQYMTQDAIVRALFDRPRPHGAFGSRGSIESREVTRKAKPSAGTRRPLCATISAHHPICVLIQHLTCICVVDNHVCPQRRKIFLFLFSHAWFISSAVRSC